MNIFYAKLYVYLTFSLIHTVYSRNSKLNWDRIKGCSTNTQTRVPTQGDNNNTYRLLLLSLSHLTRAITKFLWDETCVRQLTDRSQRRKLDSTLNAAFIASARLAIVDGVCLNWANTSRQTRHRGELECWCIAYAEFNWRSTSKSLLCWLTTPHTAVCCVIQFKQPQGVICYKATFNSQLFVTLRVIT